VLATAMQQLAPAAAAHAPGFGLSLGLVCLREALASSGARLRSNAAAPGFLAMAAGLTRPAGPGDRGAARLGCGRA